MKYVTLKQLKNNGAALYVLQSFKKLHGDRWAVTVETALAEWDEWTWYWLAQNLLSPAAWEKYEKDRDAARETYTKALATAWAKAYLDDK